MTDKKVKTKTKSVKMWAVSKDKKTPYVMPANKGVVRQPLIFTTKDDAKWAREVWGKDFKVIPVKVVCKL